jgi:hypothetical protein
MSEHQAADQPVDVDDLTHIAEELDDHDATVVLGAVHARLSSPATWRLKSVRAPDRYAELELISDDGAQGLRVLVGDGYVELEAGDFDYFGYIDSETLSELLAAVLDGDVHVVRRRRLGLTVQTFLEAGDRRWLTREFDFPGVALLAVPVLHDSYERQPLGSAEPPT